MDNLLNRGLQVGGKLWRGRPFYFAMRDKSRHNSLRCPKIADRAVLPIVRYPVVRVSSITHHGRMREMRD
jgi:hypothetical protein